MGILQYIYKIYIQIQPVQNRNIRQMCPFSAEISDLEFNEKCECICNEMMVVMAKTDD